MVGNKFFKWTVLSQVIKPDQSYKSWQCVCDCGTFQVIPSHTLKAGKSKQCRKCAFHRHNQSKTNTYKIWAGIINRCTNQNSSIYHRYGGRGIKVCERWLKFENFIEDMGERPPKLELDRINNDGNYEPLNCRWVDDKTNVNNRNLKDIMPGNKFGKWLVLERVSHKPDHWYYTCRCDCGTEKIIAGGELRRSRTTQCKKCKDIAHRGWFERRKK